MISLLMQDTFYFDSFSFYTQITISLLRILSVSSILTISNESFSRYADFQNFSRLSGQEFLIS